MSRYSKNLILKVLNDSGTATGETVIVPLWTSTDDVKSEGGKYLKVEYVDDSNVKHTLYARLLKDGKTTLKMNSADAGNSNFPKTQSSVTVLPYNKLKAQNAVLQNGVTVPSGTIYRLDQSMYSSKDFDCDCTAGGDKVCTAIRPSYSSEDSAGHVEKRQGDCTAIKVNNAYVQNFDTANDNKGDYESMPFWKNTADGGLELDGNGPTNITLKNGSSVSSNISSGRLYKNYPAIDNSLIPTKKYNEDKAPEWGNPPNPTISQAADVPASGSGDYKYVKYYAARSTDFNSAGTGLTTADMGHFYRAGSNTTSYKISDEVTNSQHQECSAAYWKNGNSTKAFSTKSELNNTFGSAEADTMLSNRTTRATNTYDCTDCVSARNDIDKTGSVVYKATGYTQDLSLSANNLSPTKYNSYAFWSDPKTTYKQKYNTVASSFLSSDQYHYREAYSKAYGSTNDWIEYTTPQQTSYASWSGNLWGSLLETDCPVVSRGTPYHCQTSNVATFGTHWSGRSVASRDCYWACFVDCSDYDCNCNCSTKTTGAGLSQGYLNRNHYVWRENTVYSDCYMVYPECYTHVKYANCIHLQYYGNCTYYYKECINFYTECYRKDYTTECWRKYAECINVYSECKTLYKNCYYKHTDCNRFYNPLG